MHSRDSSGRTKSLARMNTLWHNSRNTGPITQPAPSHHHTTHSKQARGGFCGSLPSFFQFFWPLCGPSAARLLDCRFNLLKVSTQLFSDSDYLDGCQMLDLLRTNSPEMTAIYRVNPCPLHISSSNRNPIPPNPNPGPEAVLVEMIFSWTSRCRHAGRWLLPKFTFSRYEWL